MTPWHEDPQLWSDLAPFIFPGEVLAAAPAEVEQAVALLGLAPGAPVLDLPCGPGRHTIELARRGFAVTGADRTPAYLDQARRRVQEAGLAGVRWVEADMREFREPAAFDAVFNLYTSFGYFDDPADDRRVAANFLASLRPGGRLLLDLVGKEVLARIFQPRDWREADGAILLEEREVVRHWTMIRNRWVLLKDGTVREHSFTHRLYSAGELAALLESVGFEIERVCGSLAGTPYDRTAQRLVVVARRPG